MAFSIWSSRKMIRRLFTSVSGVVAFIVSLGISVGPRHLTDDGIDYLLCVSHRARISIPVSCASDVIYNVNTLNGYSHAR